MVSNVRYIEAVIFCKVVRVIFSAREIKKPELFTRIKIGSCALAESNLRTAPVACRINSNGLTWRKSRLGMGDRSGGSEWGDSTVTRTFPLSAVVLPLAPMLTLAK